jgi:hypothetical protein
MNRRFETAKKDKSFDFAPEKKPAAPPAPKP